MKEEEYSFIEGEWPKGWIMISRSIAEPLGKEVTG